MIPNVIHFIFGLKEDFGEKPFAFIHYLTIKTAHECNKPDLMKFHYKYEPYGEWWEKSKEYLTLIKIEPPKEIFGNPLLHYAHQADVLRLEILIKEGGIYLDMDVLCLNSFEPLRKYKCVAGLEEYVGLCNAIILAEPESEFLKTWYEEYKTFRSKGKDEFWVEHSVRIPFKIAKKYSELIHIEDKFSFCWPYYYGSQITLWEKPPIGKKDSLLIKLKKLFALEFIGTSYCIHLWENIWWQPYLKEITPEYIQNTDNNFSKLCRNVLSPRNRTGKNFFFILRPLMKKMIDFYLPRLTPPK
jgi:hypothetical protein